MRGQFIVAALAGFLIANQSFADTLQMNDDNPFALPAVGAHQLRILSPTLLELTLVTTKLPEPAPVTDWNFIGDNFQFAPPITNEFTVTANGRFVSVKEIGFKRRPLYAPVKQRDLRIGNYLYLQLAQPVSDGETVQVKNLDGKLWPTNDEFTATMNSLRYSPAI